MLVSKSSGNYRLRSGLSTLAVFGVGIAIGAVVTLLFTGEHDRAIKTGIALPEIKEVERRLSTPSELPNIGIDAGLVEDSHEGEPGEHAEHGEHGEHGNSHPKGYLALFFLLSTIAFGCILQVAQERVFTGVPYTCMLFFTGIVISIIHYLRIDNAWAMDNMHNSVDMWEQIDPHLIFYIFLPALIFAEAMKMKIKLFGRLLKQVLLLAGPGVLIGTGLTATFAHYCLPYGWSWKVSLIFGSILAATDPVAVVALFNTLGVSPRLTMLVSGESLINDGTAIVIFTLLLPQVCEHIDVKHSGTWGVTFAVLRLTIFAVVLGAIIAAAFLIIIFGTASSGYHSDAMIQVAVTICCAFLSFFLAETELSTSGVLCVVSSGLVFSYAAWPRFANRETIHTVWEFIEFVGNTVIFTLAGLLFGDKCMKSLKSETLEWGDFGWLVVIYIGATVIRGSMMLFLFPLLNCAGQRITWKEALVMVWSGLRGAVGLVLAIIVDLEFNFDKDDEEQKKAGARILFHVGGMAMLTVGINAPLTAPLLRWLGLTRPPLLEDEVTVHFEKELNTRKDIRLRELNNQPWFNGADQELLADLVPPLDRDHHEEQDIRDRMKKGLADARAKTVGHIPQFVCKANEQDKLERYREVFMRAIQHHYWEDIEGGVVNRTSKVARILLYSTDHCLDEADQPLNDWDILQEMLNSTYTYRGLSKVWHTIFPHCTILEHLLPSPSSVTLWKVYASLSYIKAHQAVREQVPINLPKDSVLDEFIQEAVNQESIAQETKAKQFLNCLPSDAVEHGKTRMLAGRLLRLQIQDVHQLKNDGFLSDKGAAHIFHMVQESQRENETLHFDPENNYDSGSSAEEDSNFLMASGRS